MFLFEAAQASCTMLLPYAYQRHQPEKALLYQLVSSYYPAFREYLAREGKVLPDYVQREFEAYLKCGRLEHGFIPGILPSTPSGPAFGCSNTFLTYLSAGTVRELPRGTPVAFSCTNSRRFRRTAWLLPSCGARRMAESAALLVDEVFPHQPVRQWVLSFPFQLRLLFASRPVFTGQVLGIVY
jgi:hypothetical protein